MDHDDDTWSSANASNHPWSTGHERERERDLIIVFEGQIWPIRPSIHHFYTTHTCDSE